MNRLASLLGSLLLVYGLAGCRALPTGIFPDPVATGDPVALREAAIIDRAKASAYDELATVAEGRWAAISGTAQRAAETLGAPAAFTGLLGGLAGWMVPTPSQRRRERLAEREGLTRSPVIAPKAEPTPVEA